MTNILCIIPGKAYLPELSAYSTYFEKHGFQFDIVQRHQVSDIALSRYDVVWNIMGSKAVYSKEALNIQEFASLSCRPLARLKDWIKTATNPRPDAYVALNSSVADQLALLSSEVPVLFRDMGIESRFFSNSTVNKSYDFVYVGAMDATRQLHRILHLFKSSLGGMTILMVGEPPTQLAERFASCSNIHFQGRVEYSVVPEYLNLARFGLNFVPAVYPYYFQTSTKLLEYCAAGMDIVSNDYQWSRNFMHQRGGSFCMFDEAALAHLTEEYILTTRYDTPDVTDLTWNHVLEKSGILSFINGKLGNRESV